MSQRLPAVTVLCAALLQIQPAAAVQPYASGPLLSVLAGMPEGSWRKVNLNSFSEVWTPADLRPMQLASNPTPARLILAWSGFAWDSNRGDLILYGGGHANYSGNDVYRWRARTLKWERAALPSEIQRYGSGTVYTAIDGADAAPAAAHTYDNAVFLPIADRYINFGGASYNTGSIYLRPDEATAGAFRITGPYLFDPARADGSKVGGTTGSHVKRVAPRPDIVGGRMWHNRDFAKHLAGRQIPVRHVNGCTAYAEENGRDVVYVGAGSTANQTSPDLYRYALNDLANPAADSLARIGIYWGGPSDMTTCAVDAGRRVFVRSTASHTKPLMFWDLAAGYTPSKDVAVSVSGSVATFVNWLNATGRQLRLCAIEADPVRARFLLWCGDGAPWAVVPPTPLAATGWQMTQLAPAEAAPVPPGPIYTGILGKWKYLPGFDAFLGLLNENEGEVWIYKPQGWVPPNADNLPPSVSLQQPANGAVVTKGEPLTLTAAASDPDGTVKRVDYRVDGVVVGSAATAPYAVSWTPTVLGAHTIVASATDDDGAESEAAPAAIQVNPVPASTVPTTRVLQLGLNGYAGSADTYLDSYAPTGNRDGRDQMYVFWGNYTPLIRFALFEREGGPLPDGAQIQSAKLHLYKANYDYVYRLHPMLRRWTAHEATWAAARSGEPWAAGGANGAGSDYAEAHDAQVAAGFAPAWMTFDVTARVAAWQAGQANHGWRLNGVSGNSNLKRIYTGEYADPALRPKLEVTYTVGEAAQ